MDRFGSQAYACCYTISVLIMLFAGAFNAQTEQVWFGVSLECFGEHNVVATSLLQPLSTGWRFFKKSITLVEISSEWLAILKINGDPRIPIVHIHVIVGLPNWPTLGLTPPNFGVERM